MLWACSSVLLVHPKGGRPGDARVVTSYTGVVVEYARSFGYDRAPQCDCCRSGLAFDLALKKWDVTINYFLVVY